jgi:hypothetical protein
VSVSHFHESMKFDFVHFTRSVTMAQCTRAFVKGDNYGFGDESTKNIAGAAFA